MSRRFPPLFVLTALTLVTVTGCVSLPATSSAQPAGSREPAAQVVTAVVPTATVTAPRATATVVAPASPLPTSTTAAPTPAATAPSTAVATATLTATTASVSPTAASAPAITTYRGPNPYRATPAFEVSYDTATWQYVEDDGSGRQSQLKHRTIEGCDIWLRAGPVAAKKMADVWLADRAWSLELVQPNVIQYVSPQDDFAWIIGVLLPEEWSGRGNSSCQDAAELVIGTFRVAP